MPYIYSFNWYKQEGAQFETLFFAHLYDTMRSVLDSINTFAFGHNTVRLCLSLVLMFFFVSSSSLCNCNKKLRCQGVEQSHRGPNQEHLHPVLFPRAVLSSHDTDVGAAEWSPQPAIGHGGEGARPRIRPAGVHFCCVLLCFVVVVCWTWQLRSFCIFLLREYEWLFMRSVML